MSSEWNDSSERIAFELTGNSLSYVRYLNDFGATSINNAWTDIGGIQSRSDPKVRSTRRSNRSRR